MRGATLGPSILAGAILADARLDGATYSDAALARLTAASARMVYVQGQNDDSSPWAQRNGGPAKHPPRHALPIAVPDFSDTAMDHVDWHAAWLEGGVFTGASLKQAQLECSNLSRSDLSKAVLDGASLNDATLDGADLTGALYGDHAVWPEGFDPLGRGAVRE